MRGVFGQTIAIVAINLRALTARGGVLAATMLCVALVVATLTGLHALRQGLKNTLEQSGRSDVAIVMRGGSQAEINSIVTREQLDILRGAPGAGQISAEVNLVVDGYRREDGGRANISLRGLNATGIALRQHVSLVEGRWPSVGSTELAIGRNVARTYRGMELGASVAVGTATWRVIGIFETRGSVSDSEIWADLTTVQNLFKRANTVQSVRVQLSAADDLSALVAYNSADPRLQLTVKSEKDYYAAQAKRTSELTQKLAWPLAILMAIGAVVGALNTMLAATATRAREMATLRVVGFSRTAVCGGLIAECMLVCILAGMLGAAVAYIALSGLSATALAGSTIRIGYTLQFTLAGLWQAVLLAASIGILGAAFPAIRAGIRPAGTGLLSRGSPPY
ncbi:MAG: ABC transporter permease [Pseudomonadota bacterium]